MTRAEAEAAVARYRWPDGTIRISLDKYLTSEQLENAKLALEGIQVLMAGPKPGRCLCGLPAKLNCDNGELFYPDGSTRMCPAYVTQQEQAR